MIKRQYLLLILHFSFLIIGFAQSFDVHSLMQRNDLTYDQMRTIGDVYFNGEGKDDNLSKKHFERWMYEQKFHLNQNGTFKNAEEEYQAFLKSDAFRNSTQNSRAPYAELGPQTFNVTSGWNPGSGRTWHAAIHPSDENTIYIGTDGSGLWKTTNGGSGWTPLSDNISSSYQNVYHLAIDPANTSIVYGALKNGGIIKSIDAGATWAPTGAGPSNSRRIRVHPTNSSILFATGSNGIWRSINGGTSWTQQLTTSKEDITFKPNDPNVMYSSGSGSPTFHRSTDNGVTWTAVTAGITNSGRSLIGISAADANVLYIVQASGSVFGRIYKSVDAGLNFTTTVVGSTAAGTAYFGYYTNGTDTRGQATHDMAIAVSPTNANEVHIAGIICWKSINGATSFVATTEWSYPNATGYNHADVHSLQFINNNLYSTSDGGIFKSTNNAGDWTSLNSNLGIRQFYKIATSKVNSNVILGGAQDNGTAFRKTTGVWYEWLGADGMDCIVSPTNSSTAIGTSQYGNIYRTTNAGDSYTGLTRPVAANWVTPLVWHPTSGTTAYGGWVGVYKTIDTGTSWTKISGNTITSAMDCINIAPSNDQYIYGSVGATLYVTTNGGTSWSTYIPTGSSITSIFISPLTPSKVWITTSASSNNVLVSTNSGANFTNISAGLPALAARSIVVDDNADESMYVGMNIGVYYKDNINTAWTLHGTGLPNVAINELEITKSNSKLRVGTYGRGVWETDLVFIAQPCNAPTGLTANAVTSSSASISWNSVAGAASYELNYRAQGNPTWTILNVAGLSSNISNLVATTTYEYRVRAICGVNGYSSFNSSTFTTIAASACGGTSAVSVIAISSNNVNISWAAVADAINYTLEYKPVSSSTWASVISTTTVYNLSSFVPGRYNVRVTANCANGSGSPVNGNDFIFYCNSYGISTAEHIDFVSLGNISRSSGNDGGYYYHGTQVTNLLRGSSQSISFSAGYASTASSERFVIFIDYNRDGDFIDAGEQVAQRTNNNGSTYSRSFTVPTSAALGETMMRVVMRRGSSNPTSCLTDFSGEVEDYRVNITATAELENSDGITQTLEFFPNPVNEQLTIQYNSKENGRVWVYVYGMDGTIYKTQQNLVLSGSNQLLMDLENLANGNYILRLVNGQEVNVGRFVVIRN